MLNLRFTVLPTVADVDNGMLELKCVGNPAACRRASRRSFQVLNQLIFHLVYQHYFPVACLLCNQYAGPPVNLQLSLLVYPLAIRLLSLQTDHRKRRLAGPPRNRIPSLLDSRANVQLTNPQPLLPIYIQ